MPSFLSSKSSSRGKRTLLSRSSLLLSNNRCASRRRYRSECGTRGPADEGTWLASGEPLRRPGPTDRFRGQAAGSGCTRGQRSKRGRGETTGSAQEKAEERDVETVLGVEQDDDFVAGEKTTWRHDQRGRQNRQDAQGKPWSCIAPSQPGRPTSRRLHRCSEVPFRPESRKGQPLNHPRARNGSRV